MSSLSPYYLHLIENAEKPYFTRVVAARTATKRVIVAAVKDVQQVRGKWIVRVTVPQELRAIIGQRELVEGDLPSDTRSRERLAHGILNRFFATIDKARETLEARKKSPAIALSIAAKNHYAVTIAQDEQKRASMPTPAEIQSAKDRALEILAQEQREHRQTTASLINANIDFKLMAGARYFDHNNRARRLAALRTSFVSGETRWIEPAVQQYIKDNYSDLKLTRRLGESWQMRLLAQRSKHWNEL